MEGTGLVRNPGVQHVQVLCLTVTVSAALTVTLTPRFHMPTSF